MEVSNNHTLEKKNTLVHFMPLVLLAAFIAIFFYSFQGLYARWIKWDEGLSHGLLVNFVFIYFLYKSLPWQTYSDRKIISVICHTGLAIASIAWFIFRITNIYIFEQLILLALLIGFYVCAYGIRTVIKYRLLLLMPIFTIPLWEQLTNSLVNLSGFAVGKMVQLINIPANIEGNSIFIPSGHIVIADGCSGLRYFEIALALAYIIGILNNYTERRLLPTLAIAAALGLMANWIRIFALVIIGYQTKMQSPLMSNHEYFGWALFGLMCLPAIYFAPIVKNTSNQSDNSASIQMPHIIAPLCALAIGPILALFISVDPAPTKFDAVLTSLPDVVTKLPVPVTAPEKGFKERRALNDGQIYIEVDQYQRISKNDKLVPYINRLYDNEEWLADSQSIQLKNHSAVLTKFRQKTSGREVLQVQWFEIGSYTTKSLTIAKILQIPALISSVNNFKILTLQSSCTDDDCSIVQATLIDTASTPFSNSQMH